MLSYFKGLFNKTPGGLQGNPEPEETEEDTGKGALWDNSADLYVVDNFKIYWEMLGRVAHYQFSCMTGDENKDYIGYTAEYLKEKIGTSDLEGLSIGCGEITAPEMMLMKTGYFKNFEVMDIAEGLLKKQDNLAKKQGLANITYTAQDLNKLELPSDAYDLIWAVGTVHHIEELENFFDQVNDALKEGGILVMREYVGPNRLQLSDKQLAYVNEILSFLPDKYKTGTDGAVKSIENRVDMEELIKLDPSEAVRSEDILPLLKDKLEILHYADTGGTLLMPLLNGIASNFERDAEGDAMLKMAIYIEKLLIAQGELPSDYMFCIAGKKNT